MSSGRLSSGTQTEGVNPKKMVNLRAGSEAYRLLRRRPNAMVKGAQKNDDIGHLSTHLTSGLDDILNDSVGRGPILEIEHLYGPRLKTAEGTSRANRSKQTSQVRDIRDGRQSLLGNSVELNKKFTGFDRHQTHDKMKL